MEKIISFLIIIGLFGTSCKTGNDENIRSLNLREYKFYYKDRKTIHRQISISEDTTYIKDVTFNRKGDTLFFNLVSGKNCYHHFYFDSANYGMSLCKCKVLSIEKDTIQINYENQAIGFHTRNKSIKSFNYPYNSDRNIFYFTCMDSDRVRVNRSGYRQDFIEYEIDFNKKETKRIR